MHPPTSFVPHLVLLGDTGQTVFLIVYVALIAVVIAGMWAMFEKAGKPGWASIIPFYNTIVLLEIVGKPIWWFLLMLVPFVNIVIAIIVMIDLSKAFGKDIGYAIGLILLPFVFIPILGFGDARYRRV